MTTRPSIRTASATCARFLWSTSAAVWRWGRRLAASADPPSPNQPPGTERKEGADQRDPRPEPPALDKTPGPDSFAAAAPLNDDEGLNARERLVAAALEDHSNELAALYRWSARTVKSREPDGWTHLVSHYVRDLLNRLPEYFDIPAADRASVDTLISELDVLWSQGVPTSLTDDLRDRIEALLSEHRRGGENQERRAEAVMRAGARDTAAQAQVRAGIHAWRQLHRYFQAHAHLMSHEKARTLIVDEDRFAENFEALTELLAVRVAREGFFETLAELDALALIAEPTREHGDRAGALMRDGLADSFLTRVQSPGWLPQLQRLGVFSAPLAAVREDGYVQAPRWAAADYLTRIADAVPAEVLAVIEAAPETDNERIHISFVEAALRMPPYQASAVARLARDWLASGQVQFGLPEAAAGLAAKLAAHGNAKAARQLFESALGLRVVGDAPPQVVAHTSEWQLGEVLRTDFQSLVAADPVKAFGFLAGILQRLIETIDERLEYPQASTITRPAIEDHEQNTDVDAQAPLLVALRDLGELILREHPGKSERILTILQNGPPLLKRLALHLIRADGSPGADARRRAAMLDVDGYQGLDEVHERFLLLAEHFGDLGQDDRAAVGEIIAAGPDLDAARLGPANGDDQRERRAAVSAEWRLRWFAAISEHIPEAQIALYSELSDRYGTITHPELPWWHTSWIGPTSPEPQAQAGRAAD